jgi:hypothetical protein
VADLVVDGFERDERGGGEDESQRRVGGRRVAPRQRLRPPGQVLHDRVFLIDRR